MKSLLRRTIALLVALPAAGCDEYDPWLVAPEPTEVLGTWTGLLGTPGSGAALRMTWVVSQAGNVYEGPLTLVKPAPNVTHLSYRVKKS